MATRTTRQSLAELKESILNDKKDIVIIPADLLIKLLSTHATAQDTYTKTNGTFSDLLEKFSSQTEKTAAALNRVATALENLHHQRQHMISMPHYWKNLTTCRIQSHPTEYHLVFLTKRN